MVKTPKKQDTSNQETKSRKIKQDRYASFRLQKRIKPDAPKISSAFRLFGQSFMLLVRHWKLFGGIILVYGLLNFVLVQGLSVGTSLTEIKQSLDDLFTGNWAQLSTGLTLFLQLLGTVGSTGNEAAGAYQLLLVLIVSLALIWTLRQVYAKHKVRIRDGFYRGTYPLVQFLMILGVITLHIIPASIGIFLYSQIAANSVAATPVELWLWAGVAFILSVLSLYMVSSSLFALYIVCLPDMTPLRALRSARDLVRNRRWTVVRKVIFLPVALIVVAAIIMVPIIIFATPAATWVFLVLNMAALVVAHSYMYALYRSLL